MNEQALLDAKHIIKDRYPTCDAAILAGSVVRGEATETSDLDIVIFDFSIKEGYRESFMALNWPVEAFIYNEESYDKFVKENIERARPSLPRMIAEGVPLLGQSFINEKKSEAEALLSTGPKKWSKETIDLKRYAITDTLEDMKGATNRMEAVFAANLLAEQLHEFYLRTNNQWIGQGKWIVRSLRNFDEDFSKQYSQAFDLFYRTGEKEEIYSLVELVLHPYGGALFEGFSRGKHK